MTRYLLAVNFDNGVLADGVPMTEWKPEEIDAHFDYYRAIHKELVENGELVQHEVLAGPDIAKVVRSPTRRSAPSLRRESWAPGLIHASGRTTMAQTAREV